MNQTKPASLYPITLIISAVLVFSITFKGYAQTIIKGKILYAKDAKPAAFASVKLLTRDAGSVSDASGNFILVLKNIRKNDTLLISSVGYESLKIPAQKALLRSEFILQQAEKTMESVIIRSFSQEDVVGAKSEIVGYYRAWNTGKNGGEIGRTFFMTHKEYKVAKLRFKLYHTCDTCIIRLHIRDVKDGQPDKELLKDSISYIVKKGADADKPYEFDLNKYEIILKQQSIFVGLEVLKGSKTDSTACSISFVGSEPGGYFYKPRREDYWGYIEDYAIFMKLFFKYDD
ncbi:carboxypeptidase-like regulatory domain-containing protein [Ferruginibacter sp.]|nr:hypothetical protein [Ferruginibacter sp.]